METQNKRLLDYLQKGTTIHPLDSWKLLGIYRLSARIYDLRQDGHIIEMERIEVKNQFDEIVRVGNYKLIKP